MQVRNYTAYGDRGTCVWTSQSNQLVVPSVKLSTYGPRSFAVAGPTIWNSLPEYLRDPELSIDSFRRQLNTFLFAQCWRRHSSALETFVPSRSINLLFTLHLHIPNPAIVTEIRRNGRTPFEDRQRQRSPERSWFLTFHFRIGIP